MMLGCHISLSGPGYFLSSVEQALSFGCDTFMFYTGAPQNAVRADLAKMRIEEGQRKWMESGHRLSDLVVHAPYIINLACDKDEEKYSYALKLLESELRRAKAFGANRLVLHPGCHLGQGFEEGKAALCKALDQATSDIDGISIAIESMAGKGSEIGVGFSQLRQIIDGCRNPERIGVCLDSCHLSDSGIDVSDAERLFDEFDRQVGLDKLLVFHLNDSKNPIGSHKDRHENIGMGHIGFEALCALAHSKALQGVPTILETPYFNGKPPYKKEIEMLRSSEFDPNWREGL